MRFCILGDLELADESGPVEVRASKPRALLAMLLLHANTVVSADRLVEDLWDGTPPRSASNTLQTYVHQLRKAFAGQRLLTRAPGYMLRVYPDELDAAEFEQGLRTATSVTLTEVERITTLRDALSLWRGPVLPEFAETVWGRSEVARLEELRVSALETCIALELDCGLHAGASSELEALVTEFPLRERIWTLLMRALYADGRQADALRAYDRVRRVLVEELGIEPGNELVDLHRAVLAQEPLRVGPTRTATLPTSLQTDRDRAALRAVPLPRRLARAHGGVFVGRDHARATLLGALNDVIGSQHRRVIFVSGEPGVGKTTLLSEIAADARDLGALVLYGRSDEDFPIPFQPWRELLGFLAEHAHAIVEPHAEALEPLLGREPNRMTGDPESERYRLYTTFVDVVARISTLVPVMILLDDLHAADGPTIELLCHLARVDTDLPVLVVGTYRDTDLRPDGPLTDALALLQREEGVDRLGLSGLAESELLVLLEQLAKHEMDEGGVALRDALLAETDGNPFFATEIIRHLQETGAISTDAESGRWVTNAELRAHGLPVSLQEVIIRRVARLGNDARRALSYASVIGRDFDLTLLADVLGHDLDELLDIMEPAWTHGVVFDADPGQYTFSHALIGRALYDGLSVTRRARVHDAVASAIELRWPDDLRARAGELARHWTRAATPQANLKALRYAEIAGDDALERLAPLEAARWYTNALEMGAASRDDTVRVRLLVSLGTAQRHAGDPASRTTLLDAARLADDIGDVGALVQAALANTRGWNTLYGAVDHEKVTVLHAALDQLRDDRSILRARLLTLLCLETYYRVGLNERLELAEEAVDIARRVDDPGELAEVLTRTHEAISMPQTLELRVRWTSEAVAILDGLDTDPDRSRRMGQYIYRCLSALEDAEGEELRRVATTAFGLVDDATLMFAQYNQKFHLVWMATLDGDIARAEQLAEEALSLGLAAGQSDAFTIYGAQLVHIRWLQGRLPELVDVVAESVAANPGLDVYRAVDCWVKAHAGREAEARALLDRELATRIAAYDDQHWLTGQTVWAYAAAMVGHRDAAILLRDRLAPWSRQCVSTHITFGGAVAQYLAMLEHTLGHLDAANDRYAEALTVHERLASPILIAWTKAAWARMLEARNHPEDGPRAQTLRDEALHAAHGRAWGLIENVAAS